MVRVSLQGRCVRAALALLFVIPQPQLLLAANQPKAADRGPRATILDLTGLEGIDVDPLSSSVLYQREDLVLGEGTQRFAIARTWSPWSGSPHNVGLNWASCLDARLAMRRKTAVFFAADGGNHVFHRRGSAFVAVEGRAATLVPHRGGHRIQGLGDGQTYRFDAAGNLVEQRSPGLVVRFLRDADGQLNAIRGPWGEVELVRDDDGFLTDLRAPGRSVRYSRDAHANLTRVERGALYETYTYDARGLLTSVAGGRALVHYDAFGRVSALLGSGVVPVRLSYASTAGGGGEVRVDRGGRVTTLRVSQNGRRVERLLPSGLRRVETFDERGRPARLQEGELEWTWTYDARGRLTQLSAPEGVTRSIYGSPHSDEPTQIVLPDERRVRFAYDARGRVTAVSLPGLGTTRYAYDAEGRLQRVTNARGAVTRMGHDRRGYLVRVKTDGIGTTRFRRGQDGSVEAIKHADGRVVRFDADANGRVLRVRDKEGLIGEKRWDHRGQLVQRTDAFGRVSRFTWNERGQLTAAHTVEDGELRPLAQLTYDLAGRLASLTDAGGNQTQFTRPTPRTLVVRDPAAGLRVVESDVHGRPVRERRGDATLTYAYDHQGNLTKRTTPRGAERFEYDAFGRLARSVGPDGGFAFAYDLHGRLASRTHTELGERVSYRYDDAGDRAEVRAPWGTIRYGRDVQGRLTSVTTPEGERIRFDLLADGRRAAIHYPNGVSTTFSYERTRLTEIATRATDGELRDLRRYAYDAQGRVAAITDARGQRTELQHDARGRLVEAKDASGTRRYTYDANGNRIAESWRGAALPVEVGAGNRVLRHGTQAFDYSATGALTAAGEGDAVTRYTYDVDNQLVAVQGPGAEPVRYGYSPGGARLWRSGSEGRTDYLYDGSQLLAEYRDGEPLTTFVAGDGVDDVLSARHGGASVYYHYDRVRSVTSLTDADGELAARYAYAPFGEQLVAEGPAARWNPLRYTSRPFDGATGLYDYRARTYDPALGRFTSPDPSGQQGGLNLYAYANNDPSTFNDPYGLWPEWVEDLASDVGEFFSDAGEVIVDGAKTLYNGAKKVVKAAYDFIDYQVAFVQGFFEGAWAGIEGLWNMITDLPGTIDAIKYALENPQAVIEALGKKWDDYKKAFHENPREFVRMTGHLIGELAIGVVGTKGLEKLAKIPAMARTIQALKNSAPVKAAARAKNAVKAKVGGAAKHVADKPGIRHAVAVAKPPLRGAKWLAGKAYKPFDMFAEGVWWLPSRLTRNMNRYLRYQRALARRQARREAGDAGGALARLEGRRSGSGTRHLGHADGPNPDADLDVDADADVDADVDADDVVPQRVDPSVWNTPQGTSPKVGQFDDIYGATPEEIISRIPEHATGKPMFPKDGGVAEGYKWQWKDADGVTNRLRIHGPDAGPKAGPNARSGWVIKRHRGSKVQDSNGNWHPTKGISNPDSPNFNEAIANDTHIPLAGNPVLRQTRPNPATLDRVGPPSHVMTGHPDYMPRPTEWPYTKPRDMRTVAPNRPPFDLKDLDPDQTYLWVVDEKGGVRIAPERQPGFGVTEHMPDGRVVKHGDLVPDPTDPRVRGAARAGGELKYENGRWVMDNNSSYSFMRLDGQLTNQASLEASRDLLRETGAQIDGLELRNILGE